MAVRFGELANMEGNEYEWLLSISFDCNLCISALIGLLVSKDVRVLNKTCMQQQRLVEQRRTATATDTGTTTAEIAVVEAGGAKEVQASPVSLFPVFCNSLF